MQIYAFPPLDSRALPVNGLLLHSHSTALRISGYDSPLTVGDSATITCSSGLNVDSVRWFYDGQVVGSFSSSQALLQFDLVDDSIHNRQYICRVQTSQGNLDQAINISVQGWLSKWSTNLKFFCDFVIILAVSEFPFHLQHLSQLF